MTTCRHIAATFGGQSIRFELTSDSIAALENSLRVSAFDLLKHMVAGRWTMRQLFLVLSAAIPSDQSGGGPDGTESKAAELERLVMATSGRTFGQTVVESPAVKTVLDDNPPARYAALAVAILDAALFGVDAEQATFDEKASEEAA